MKTAELTEDRYKELQATHPSVRLAAVTIGGHDIVLKAPPRQEWKRFRSMVLDPTKKADANQTLVQACLVHPPLDIFHVICEDRPALLDKAAEKVAELAGVDDEVIEKKFRSFSETHTNT